MAVIGWDIGGVNTKVARVESGTILTALSHPFEIQRDPGSLAALLAELAQRIDGTASDRHAVTMTAELSQMFRTKRDGVTFVLDALAAAFGTPNVHVYTVDGRFVSLTDANREPLTVAASNWAATARIVALDHPDSILIDIGTTTTDIIPIVAGDVAAMGTTDPARLTSGELVYTGALRTPVEAIVHAVPIGHHTANVSAEGFALIGDVHVWRGDLSPDDYSVATPDGRPPVREFARERIARVVCADRELLDDDAISDIANAVAEAQSAQIVRALRRVRSRHPSPHRAIVTGLGAFIAERAARDAGLTPIPLAAAIGRSAARAAPAAAVALLLEGGKKPAALPAPATRQDTLASDSCAVDVVVKIGGGLLSAPKHLASVIDVVVAASRDTPLVIVPGGGPFANTVREIDATFDLPDDAAHWMAILAMDQYAHLLASRHSALTVVESHSQIADTLAASRVPVIAPYRWLRDANPLPHSWDVTSDSLSAWISGELGAKRLVLVKPRGASGEGVVDPYFATALPPQLLWSIAAADSLELRSLASS